ncbi:MAG: CcmD family protein [Desulfovibrio sp.]|jgi:CcmD family protein|nr:CcmD family protein [Desulfovibrio sp.]
MDTTIWLTLANAAVWIGLGAYIAFLGLRQHALSERLAQWERLQNKHDKDD